MWRIALGLVAALGLGLIFALAQNARQPLVRLARGLLIGVAAVLGTAGLAIAATGVAEEASFTVKKPRVERTH